MFSLGLFSQKWIRAAQKTEKETRKYNDELYKTWNKIIKTFDLDLKMFIKMNQTKIPEYQNSLIFMEMLSFNKRLANVQNLAVWGFYHSAMIELRFMLETTTLAFYLDQELPNTKRSEKIKLMNKHKGELWGSRLRRRAYSNEPEFGDKIEEVVEAINTSIDEYLADLTVESWQMKSLPFSEKDYNECVFHTKNVSALIINHFIKSFTEFKYSGELAYNLKVQTESKKIEE